MDLCGRGGIPGPDRRSGRKSVARLIFTACPMRTEIRCFDRILPILREDPLLTTGFHIKMAFNNIFSTPEEILQEFQRQSLEEDDLEGNYLTTDNEVASESDNEILPDLRVQDEFEVVEDENERSSEDDLGNSDERQFELGKDGGSQFGN
ncbi:unnamed protein product [Nesidiocoris tenuis]|uniref:Uncharacterized protein n=1 Tax=Nesidiocoris tenuis TaxID=355587 RepID=A0A6H5GMG1_9HEMI|nr:unnamed protein product [Nesidiocoris tenuis]